ncbi:MAG: hypothetical protein IPP77_04320 [Bacteroidetes bacterium]|nr:hypothetical protein [Bacteroidota bacterium]
MPFIFKSMRNTTKLKTLLIKYTVSLDMDDDGGWVLLLTDKGNNEMKQFEGESYSRVLSLAYSFLLRDLKKDQL